MESNITYISLGEKCSIKYQIKKHRNNDPTLFFDWLYTSVSDLIYLFENYKDIDKIILKDKFKVDNSKKIPNFTRVLFTSLTHTVSLHDIKDNHTDNDFLDLAEKYKRRFNRVIELINSNKKLCFVRHGAMSIESKNKFVSAIKKINPMCDFILVHTNIYQISKNTNNQILNNTLNINLNNYILDVSVLKAYWWTLSKYDWNAIFVDIEKAFI